MSAFLTPNIRISDAAAAVGMETKALRNWFTERKVSLTAERTSERGWRAFSFADVAWLAVMREFVRYGFQVEDAEAFAGAVLTVALGPNLEAMKKLPPDLYEATLEGWAAVAYHLSDGPIVLLVPPGRDLTVRTSAVVVRLRPVVADAFAALAAAGYGLESA